MSNGKRNSDQDEAENSGQAFQNDVNDLYGSVDEEETEETSEEEQAE